MSRIALVAHAVYPGDPRLRRQTDALVAAGHEVDLFCLRAPGEMASERVRGVRVFRLPVHRAFSGFAGHMAEYLAFAGLAAFRLAREHGRRRYRLVQVATLPDFLAFAAAPLKLSGVPLLLDLHEDMPEFFRDRFAHPALQPLLPAVAGAAKASAWVADEIITVHEPLRELSIARGVPPDKISVVMNSADTELFDAARHPHRPFMEDGELRLIHHSNLQRIYGLEILIEAITRLGGELPLRADIYGDGPYRPHLEAAVARTGTADRVHLNGPVPIDELPALIAKADVGVIPSMPEPYMQYSLSTKLLEYAAMGMPIVASDLRTIRAHFTDEAILFVPGGNPGALANALRSLAADPVTAARLGAEAHRQEAQYEWADQAKRYVAIVERLLGR
jgi:glycosyltransferase involved in cell wall biosynthesis